MTRAVPEWIGNNDNAVVPPHVRLRIFEREKGICHLSGRKIMASDKWDLDHKIALCNGGEHRESNLFPALRDKHHKKTKADVAEKSLIYRKRTKHLGIKRKSNSFSGNRNSGLKKHMDGTVSKRA